MSETISVPFPEISGDVTGYTAFLRNSAGTLLNTSGDAITEVGATGHWAFTLTETRVKNANYFVAIYSGSTESAQYLVYYDVLYAGQMIVGVQADPPVIFGIVGATAPLTTSFTPSEITPEGGGVSQWVGRLLVFDNDTTTAALRGQMTDITAQGTGVLPLLTFTALTTPPVSGDKFKIA